ncbi:MAG: radical SAM family heme chaperone HemW [Saprospiraceae bacterium]|nr:radical SAM family heme chaperone HemW [Saprospiraceae bacterium]
MAGIYIHIPFCKQACNYCNFHFSTSLAYKDALLDALCSEIRLRANYLTDKTLDTIYFGGGTPSLLSIEELNRIFGILELHFDLSQLKEVTLEANPDDLNRDYIQRLRNETRIDRLSIGIQSFREEDLIFMKRAHNAAEALDCIKLAKEAGFRKFTIDLIYGTPGMSDEAWLNNLRIANELGMEHLSCYALTLETGTPLAKEVSKRPEFTPLEADAERQFRILMEFAEQHDYEQYEISNFARNEQYAIHNSAYWKGASYLGLGPSAHSFNGSSRAWNIANNQQYIKSLNESTLPLETENLTLKDHYNEWILTD